MITPLYYQQQQDNRGSYLYKPYFFTWQHKENRSITFIMATASNKTPPLFNKSKSYSDWVRLVKLWTKFTDLKPTRQGPALVMSLEGKALDTISKLDDKDISHEDGVTLIINKLNKLYKKDELNEKFEDLEKFENYKRSSETPMQQFLADF